MRKKVAQRLPTSRDDKLIPWGVCAVACLQCNSLQRPLIDLSLSNT